MLWRPGKGKDVDAAPVDVLFFTLEIYDPYKKQYRQLVTDPPKRGAPRKGEYLVKDLKPGMRYEFRVIAYNDHGQSKGSVGSFYTLPEVPQKPKLLQCALEGTTAIATLSWGKGNAESVKCVTARKDSLDRIFDALSVRQDSSSQVISASALRENIFVTWIKRCLKSKGESKASRSGKKRNNVKWYVDEIERRYFKRCAEIDVKGCMTLIQ